MMYQSKKKPQSKDSNYKPKAKNNRMIASKKKAKK